MKNIIVMLALSFGLLGANAQATWAFDEAHTSVRFTVTHLAVNEVNGIFKTFSGSVVSKNDDFTDAQIDFKIDVASLNTENAGRDKHLKSDDFFNAEKYPAISFKGTSFKKAAGNRYVLEGDLTIRDVTKPVKLDVVYNGTVKDNKGVSHAGFKVTGTINRFDYNLKWNALVEAGPVVGKDVKMVIDVELKN